MAKKRHSVLLVAGPASVSQSGRMRVLVEHAVLSLRRDYRQGTMRKQSHIQVRFSCGLIRITPEFSNTRGFVDDNSGNRRRRVSLAVLSIRTIATILGFSRLQFNRCHGRSINVGVEREIGDSLMPEPRFYACGTCHENYRRSNGTAICTIHVPEPTQ